MEKNANQHQTLKVILRLIINLILGAVVSLLFLFVLFKDNDTIVELLFSPQKFNAQFFTLVIVAWFFGAIVGAIISSMEFINALVEKDNELKEIKEKNNRLRILLGKVNKKFAKSPASRMFVELEDMEFSRSSSGEDDFTTLQEQLKANSKDNK